LARRIIFRDVPNNLGSTSNPAIGYKSVGYQLGTFSQKYSSGLIEPIGGGGGDSEFLNNQIFYVSKSYNTPGNAVVSGLTLLDIASSNTTYSQQLSNAMMGSRNHPYPCPWSARNAALDAINSSTIQSALVMVLDSEYTVGSDDPSSNGSIYGTAGDGTITDVQFSSANTTDISSLLKDKISYYFNKNSGVVYLNSSYSIYFGYNIDISDSPWESSILGEGYFKQIFGEVNGWNALFIKIDNARSIMRFECDYISLQQWDNFLFLNFKDIDMHIRSCELADTNFIGIGSDREGDGDVCNLSVNIDNIRFGDGVLSVPTADDFWYNIVTYNVQSLRFKNIHINYNNTYCKINPVSLFYGLSDTKGVNNFNFNFKSSNFIQEDPGVVIANSEGLICILAGNYSGSPTASYTNNSFIFNFGSVVTETTLASTNVYSGYCVATSSVNNTFHLIVDKHVKKINPYAFRAAENIRFGQSGIGGETASVSIEGDFYNSEAEVISFETTSELVFVPCKVNLKGYYKTSASTPVIAINMGNNKCVSLVDAILVNSLLGTNPVITIINDSPSVNPITTPGSPYIANRDIYIKNVHSTYDAHPSIIQNGETMSTNIDINSYY
jgi:hypothetical protein